MAIIRVIKCKKCGLSIRLRTEDGNFGKFKCVRCGSDKGIVKNTFIGK